MTTSGTSWSRERSCGRCSPSWRCTRAGSSRPSRSSTRCGARIRPRRCATACKGSRRSCAARWARPTSSSMRGGGYALELPPDAVDVHRYEQLVAAGQRGRGRRRSEPARRAAGRGRCAVAGRRRSPTSPTRSSPPAAITRLSELRLAVIEERLDLELAARSPPGCDRRSSRTLVAAHPLRERLRGLLMLALVPRRAAGRRAPRLPGRSSPPGRGARASNPGHELRQLESAILAQDRSLDASGRRAVAARSPCRDALDASPKR